MMKTVDTFKRLLSAVFQPIRVNAVFFLSMYLLGIVCSLVTLPDTKGASLYDNLFLELFVDVYICCLILTLIPKRVRRYVKWMLYAVLYAVAIVDIYCFWKFDSTLTPTMILLVGETDAREAGEFLRSYLSLDVILGPVGWVLLLIAVHITVAVKARWLNGKITPKVTKFEPWLGLAASVLIVWGVLSSWHNKAATWKLMSGSNIGEVEHTLTESDHAELYLPIYRLIFSLYANHLTEQQVDQLIAAIDRVRVDSCSYTSPNIVLIIGESYGKLHSQQYGYFMKTTPRQVQREKTGLLVKFSDVVAPWNLTSFVFKNLFSMHVVGQKGEWCDYPLFTELFRKAGYHVTFLTNQFLPKAKEAVYDFSGGFFLNNPQLSKTQFDTRNTQLHKFDEGLLDDYDKLQGKLGPHNLIIFHLIGQHVGYQQRFPRDRQKFYASSYEDTRPELNERQRKILSCYDNACLYNDSIVDQICKRFEDKDAIVIYMPDHGEECYEGNRGFTCRNHSAAIDWPLAHYEFEIPFWIFCSHQYAVNHPDIYRQIVQAKDRRLMTDALAHTLLYLAGISAPDYHAEYDVLSPEYDEMRPRILKGTADYDKLREEAQHEQ